MSVFVFFFKQKTAYEVRISDWSSDVCSSDLMDKERTDRSAGDLHGRAERLGLPAHCEHFLAEWVGNDAGVALDAALQCDIDHPGKEHVAQDAAAFGSVPLGQA